MNDGDVFRKSDVGREEIKSQSLGVLPREARTLLIMIDGKRTYQNYLDTLDNSKMFADFGGVAPLFELLLELECIEVANTINTRARIKTDPQASSSTQVPEILRSQSTQNSFDTSTETEFDRTFNSKSPSSVIDAGKKSLGGIFKSKVSDSNYGTIKSDLATYIEKNAPPAEAWGYLLSLEQCNDSSQLLRLAQEIQKSSNANLSRGMNEFIKRTQ
ncbi:hypothetical protein ACTXGL_07105 [Psychrobacter sp. T6-6]|uniref:hypothetical protein n=1 Tax=Psychrobacter sp. T6-6 TaxID=3457452 RepID=UPI003FD0399F